MIRKKQLQKLSETKLDSLKEFNKNGYYDMVIAQHWIVVDSALKAFICKRLKKDIYPDYIRYKTSDIEKLINIANLRENMEKRKKQ